MALGRWLAFFLIMGGVAGRVSAAVPDFVLPAAKGKPFQSGDYRGPALVVAFLGVDCPLAKLYAQRLNALALEYETQRVTFVAIDSNEHDSSERIAEFQKSMGLVFPMLRDGDGTVARSLGATRSPEVILLDPAREMAYRGRIDNQYEPGVRRAEPSHEELRDALEDVLAGRPVRTAFAAPVGCFLNLRDARPPVDQARDKQSPRIAFNRVQGILQKHCVECHRPGQVAPFSLRTFDEVQPWASTIREVVEQGRMPPWHANPNYGHFANERQLTDDERRTLLEWIDLGTLAERQNVLTKTTPDPGELPRAWSIGTPDAIIALPEPIDVPAAGVIDYQYITVDPHFSEDRWIQAAELLPGNCAVVHHATAFLSAPGTSNQITESGELGSSCLVTYVPGQDAQVWPPGVAKRIPAGWRILFVVHYVPTGTPQTDRTELGLKFINTSEVRKELATKVLIDPALKIPPHAADHRVEQSWQAPADMLLYAMFPHMHLRGKSFRYDLTYPDGHCEILLDVPRYDFNWQHRYVLAEPKRVPVGSVLRCEAHYDNSTANPANPDPNATVLAGQRSSDEMFNGYFDVALADQDLVADSRWQRLRRFVYGLGLMALCGMLGWSAFCTARRRSV